MVEQKKEHFVTHEKSRGIQILPSTDKILLAQQPYPLGSLLSELSTWLRHHPASTPKMRILCPTAGKTCWPLCLKSLWWLFQLNGSLHLGFSTGNRNLLMNYQRSLSLVHPTNLYASPVLMCWGSKEKQWLSRWVVSLTWPLEVVCSLLNAPKCWTKC